MKPGYFSRGVRGCGDDALAVATEISAARMMLYEAARAYDRGDGTHNVTGGSGNDRLDGGRGNDTLDGEFQKFSVAGGAYIREHFFGPDPRLQRLLLRLGR